MVVVGGWEVAVVGGTVVVVGGTVVVEYVSVDSIRFFIAGLCLVFAISCHSFRSVSVGIGLTSGVGRGNAGIGGGKVFFPISRK